MFLNNLFLRLQLYKNIKAKVPYQVRLDNSGTWFQWLLGEAMWACFLFYSWSANSLYYVISRVYGGKGEKQIENSQIIGDIEDETEANSITNE